jgi:hypothetical protein
LQGLRITETQEGIRIMLEADALFSRHGAKPSPWVVRLDCCDIRWS